MQLNITGEFVKSVLEASPKNSDLLAQIADQLLASVDQGAMAAYLLTREAAVSLLAERLAGDPVGTVNALQGLPGREESAPKPARRGREKAATAAKPRGRRPGAKGKGKGKGKGKRQRLTSEQAADLKQQVRAFLKSNGWSTRRELTAAVELSTQAIYRRIMGELQEEGIVVAQGQKATAVYGLK